MIFLVLVSLLVACCLVGSFMYPSTAFVGFLCLFGIKQWVQSVSPVFAVYGTIPNWIIGCMIVLTIAVKIVRGKSVFICYPKIGWLVIALFVYAFMSASWSPLSVTRTYGIWSGDLPYLVLAVLLGPLLVSSTDEFFDAYRGILVIGIGLVCLLLLTSHWTSRGVAIVGMNGRVAEGNPLAVAEMAGYVLSAAILLNFRRKRLLWEILRWLIAAACLALAAKSGSRGQFFGMMTVAGVYMPVSRRIVKPSHFMMFFVGIMLLGFLGDWALHSFSAESARWQTTKMQADVYDRLGMAFKLLDHWSKSPLSIVFGVGNSASFDVGIAGFYPHIVPLEIVGEEGLVGAALFVGIIASCVWSFARVYREVRLDSVRRGVLAVLGATLSLELLLSFKQGSMIGSPFLFFFPILLGKYELLVFREKRRKIGNGIISGIPANNTRMGSTVCLPHLSGLT